MIFLTKHHLYKTIFSATGLLLTIMAFCQPNTTIDLDKSKPKQYEDRKLASEKTPDKKISATKKFYQNTVTHYNYYFNANTKLNNIITTAKASYKDDYTQLLSFYNYTLDGTAKEKQTLDTIIYKCNAGILLHDLRNSWVDDLYLLLGKAFLLRKQFDSAAQVFQYINYIYAPKDDGYDILLGSNTSNTNGVFTVSTKEDQSLLKKISTKPPARNESFIWQSRNYLEQNKLAEASGLLSILRADPFFPQRLQTDLHEMIAYSFYKQQVYDSAAWHLQKALENAAGVAEEARWEFLCGQLYQLSKKNDAAIAMFQRSIKHTIDPFMDVYARLNIVSLASAAKKETALQENLNELYKLAKRDKFENYRDIIYYAAAILQLQQQKNKAAKADLTNSIRFNVANPKQKAKSFLLLADINYDEQLFIHAADLYDSVQTNVISREEKERVDLRKPALKIIAKNLNNIHLQDSLLHLASLSEAERIAAVKKIYKQIRKEQGLKEADDLNFGSGTNLLDPNNAANANLFNTNASSPGSDFYFLNASLKAQGFRDFKTRWGTRPNADNWRRQSAVSKFTAPQQNNNGNAAVITADVDQPGADAPKGSTGKDLTPQGLLLSIPTTPKKITAAEQSVAKSFFTNGETFQNKLEEYEAAIASYDSLLKRFPDNSLNAQALFNLAYCYKKLGRTALFDSVKNVLNTTYADDKLTSQINNGGIDRDKLNATEKYESVYNLFIEGKFDEAKKEKLNADNLYGKKYWTPQLLFIESVYYIKQKQDSIAIDRLESLSSGFPGTPMADKAKTMVSVLRRRNEIENYLTNLQIEKNEDSVVKRVDLNSVTAVTAPAKDAIKKDTVAKVAAKEIKARDIKADLKPAIIAADAYAFVPVDAQYVTVIFHKVDRVFTSEARNAFNRYNLENYYNKKIDLSSININSEYDLLLIGPFANAGDAVNYADNVSPVAKSRIIPWLTKDKYSFSIISNKNLDLLKTTKDVGAYMKFIHQIFPDKF